MEGKTTLQVFFFTQLTSKGTEVVKFNIFIYFLPHLVK